MTTPDAPTPLRQLRHDLRGRANTLVLCATALELSESREETLEMLDHIVLAADKVLGLLDQLDQLPEADALAAT